MKKLIFAGAAAALLCSGVASAQFTVNYGSPTYSTALTNAQVFAVAGDMTGATFVSASLATAPDGDLYVLLDPSGTGAIGTGLLKMDPDANTGVVYASDAALAAVLDNTVTTADTDVTSICATGTDVYLIDREETDEVASVNSGGSVALLGAAFAHSDAAFSNIATDGTNVYYAAGGTNTGVYSRAISGGAESTLVNTAAYVTATSSTSSDLGVSGSPVISGGDLYVFDANTFNTNGAPSQLLKVDLPGGTMSIEVADGVMNTNGTSDVNWFSMCAAENGDLIALETAGTGGASGMAFYTPGSGTITRLSWATIQAGLSLGAVPFTATASDTNYVCARHTVLSPTTGQLDVFFTDTAPAQANIYAVSFPTSTGSPVSDWGLY